MTNFDQIFVLSVYTAMVKDSLGEWDRVYTFCALLVDLGSAPIPDFSLVASFDSMFFQVWKMLLQFSRFYTTFHDAGHPGTILYCPLGQHNDNNNKKLLNN